MSNITLRQNNSPVAHVPNGQLMKPLSQMEYISELAFHATNQVSDMYFYSLLKMLMTVQQAEQLKQTYQGRMPPDVEATYNDLTKFYLSLMKQIPQEVSARLLEGLKRIPANVGDESLWAKVRALLGG